MTKVIGLTGGIGSGKTIVCNVFKHLGIPIYDADIESKKLVNSSMEIRKKLISLYGNFIYLNNRKINSKKLSKIIFNNKVDLEKVNKIIHPVVLNDFREWLVKHGKSKYVILEAAILFESGAFKITDVTTLIYSPENLRISRVVERDNVSEKDVFLRIKNQISDDEKKKLVDYIIINDDKEFILPQILKLHKVFNK